MSVHVNLTTDFPLQIVIGAIIENSPAERDGRLRPGDELVSVDRMPVAGRPHRYVIDLMHAAARNGQVTLTVRRRVLTQQGERTATLSTLQNPRVTSSPDCPGAASYLNLVLRVEHLDSRESESFVMLSV